MVTCWFVVAASEPPVTLSEPPVVGIWAPAVSTEFAAGTTLTFHAWRATSDWKLSVAVRLPVCLLIFVGVSATEIVMVGIAVDSEMLSVADLGAVRDG
jgi:hypothetical protein